MTVSATVQLYGDIGLYSDYNRTIDFESVEDQEAWFDSQTVALTLDNVAYDKFQNTFACAIDYSTAVTYTYVRVANIDSTGKTFYCFVSAVELVDETRCRFVLTVDVLQTYMFQYDLGVCAINRQHLDRWTSSSDYPVYIPMDVPSDIGGDFVVYSEDYEKFEGQHICIIGVVSSYEYADDVSSDIKDQDEANRIDWYCFPCWPTSPTTSHYGVMNFTGMAFYLSKSDQNTGDDDYGGYLAINYPYYSQILDGSLISVLGLNPDEVIGVWVLPFASMAESYQLSAYYDYTNTKRTVYLLDGNIPEYCFKSSDDYDYSNKNSYSGYIEASSNTGQLFPNPYHQYVATELKDLTRVSGRPYMAYRLSHNTLTKPSLQSLADTIHLGDFSASVPSKPSGEGIARNFKYESGMYQNPFTTYAICHHNGQVALELPNYFIVNNKLYDSSSSVADYGTVPIFNRTYVTAQGVKNLIYVANHTSALTTQKYVNDVLCLGLGTLVPALSGDITSNEWLSYCLTEKDTDRKLAITRAITSTISGTARGFKTDPDKVPPVGIGPGSLAVGVTQGMMGGIDTVASQLALESKKRNAPDSMLVTGTGVVTITNDEDEFQLNTLMLNDVDREKEWLKMFYFGYKVSQVDVPDIRTRHYFNYLSISDGYIVGSLSQDIKNQILNAYKGGITIFHYPACESVDYPTTSAGTPYENIEEALL